MEAIKMDLTAVTCVSVNMAAKIVRVAKTEIMNACDCYRQSGGRDGLACFTSGTRTVIRVGAILEWLRRREKMEVA